MNWIDVLGFIIALLALITSVTIYKSAYTWPGRVSHTELLLRMDRLQLRVMCGNVMFVIALIVSAWRFGVNGIIAFAISYFIVSWLWRWR